MRLYMSFLGRASCGFEGSMVTSKGIEGLNSAEYKVCLTSQTTTLQGQGLNTEAAQELIQASKAVGWSNLCPMLNKLADVICRVKKSVALLTAAFQALTLLLGELLSSFQILLLQSTHKLNAAPPLQPKLQQLLLQVCTNLKLCTSRSGTPLPIRQAGSLCMQCMP